MRGLIVSSLIVVGSALNCTLPVDKEGVGLVKIAPIVKVEMELSAFGVESDDFPSINASLDFVHNTGNCVKSFYNPSYKGFTYRLSSVEMMKVFDLIKETNWDKLKPAYNNGRTDQPTSTIIIYTTNKIIAIKDYGLVGDNPLQELYRLVYKL